jgi:CheY-like chemotaxis protein
MKRPLKRNQRGRQTGRKSAIIKVLYVEHDDDNLYMLKRRLERCGDFEVLAAKDSERAAI